MKIKSKVLIIAGSDSSGGAGIQADIKTVSLLGSYAMTAITAVTAQNTVGVQSIHPLPIYILSKNYHRHILYPNLRYEVCGLVNLVLHHVRKQLVSLS